MNFQGTPQFNFFRMALIEFLSLYKEKLKSSVSFLFGEGFQYELSPIVEFTPDVVVLANLQIDVVGRHQGLIKLRLGDEDMQQPVLLEVGHGMFSLRSGVILINCQQVLPLVYKLMMICHFSVDLTENVKLKRHYLMIKAMFVTCLHKT